MPQSHARDEIIRVTKRLNSQYAERGDIAGARGLIESMLLARGLMPNLVTANTLIKTYRVARQPEGAEAVLREFPYWHLRPDGCTYSTLVDAYGIVGRVADAYRMVSAAEEDGVADSRVYSALLRFTSPDKVEHVMARVVARRVAYDAHLCHAALNTLSSAARVAEMEAFVRTYMSGSVQPDQRTCALVTKAHCAAGHPEAAEAQLAALTQRGYQVDAVALCTVMNAYVSRQPPNIQAALALMEGAEARGVRPDTAMYNTLIKGYACMKPPQPQAAEALLHRIRQVGLRPSAMTICLVMDAYCELNLAEKAEQLAQGAIRDGLIQPSEIVYNTLIKAVSRCRCKSSRGECKCGDVCGCCQPQRGIQLLEEMARHGLHPDTITINTLLDAHCSAHQLPQAWMLLDSLVLQRRSKPTQGEQRSYPNSRSKHNTSRAFEPDVSTFQTLFHAMLREAQSRSAPRRPEAVQAVDLDGSGSGSGGGGGDGTGAGGGNSAVTRSWLLQTLNSGVALIRRLGLAPDERLLTTLEGLCRELHVNWERSTGLERLQEAVEEAEHRSDLLPSAILGDVVNVAPRSAAAGRSARRLEKQQARDANRAAAAPPPLPLLVRDSSFPKCAAPGSEALATGTELREVKLKIDGLHCQGCVGGVQSALAAVPGAVHVSVSLETRMATVHHAEGTVEPRALIEAVVAVGKSATLLAPEAAASLGNVGGPAAAPAPTEADEQRFVASFEALSASAPAAGTGPFSSPTMTLPDSSQPTAPTAAAQWAGEALPGERSLSPDDSSSVSAPPFSPLSDSCPGATSARLDADERQELLRLRRRVAELEATLRSIAALVPAGLSG